MNITYQDLYWGARYHLKKDELGQYYLVGVKQKIFVVLGVVCLIPLVSSVVMAVVSVVRGTGNEVFFIGCAIFLSLLCTVFFSCRERFIFGRNRIAHCVGWRGLSLSQVTFWLVSDCKLTVTPIIEYKKGCWLELSAKGERVWRNSIGNFEQTAELADFLGVQHGIEVFDHVSDWPNIQPLFSASDKVSVSAKSSANVYPLNASSQDAYLEYQVHGSLWRLLFAFPAAMIAATALYLFSVLSA
ncbi:hypothetical protein [Enterovibrio nigricans]|uniref:Uncharacterized protein n=1 Tax=Enterovibrio nigricans DSM 22720 TaxID=1121868 RepID=A0A1T4UTM5_9GAMM|nr:hypothetical protein [Enterovibrio nigricans]SKA56067.1 hypothetical protein SAMN02745132_02506 [Enterovibrio nigricans DSM 22720]